MKIKYLLIIQSLIFFCQCNSATNLKENTDCKENGTRANKLILEYKFYHDTTYIRLDSALSLIDSVFCDCSKYYAGLTSSKLKILSYKKEYSNAISFIKTLDDRRLPPSLKKSILLNRFYAMQSQNKGDTISRNKFIKDIVVQLGDSLSSYSMKTDSVLRLSNVLDISKYDKCLILMQYYYYRSQIEGINKICDELDSFQKRINGNQDFFNNVLKKSLKDDFMTFNGL